MGLRRIECFHIPLSPCPVMPSMCKPQGQECPLQSFLRLHFTWISSYSLPIFHPPGTPVSPEHLFLHEIQFSIPLPQLAHLAALLELMPSAWPSSCCISSTHWSQLSCSHGPPIFAFFWLSSSNFKKTSSNSLLVHPSNLSSQTPFSSSCWHQTHLTSPCFPLS